MATHYLEPGQLPDGVVLQHTLYGRPDESVTNAWATPSSMGGVQPAPEGEGVPYIGDRYANDPRNADVVSPEPEPDPEPVPEPDPEPVDVVADPVVERAPDREKRCMANGDTCRGWRIKDSDFCSGHAGKLLNPAEQARRAAFAEFE